MTTLEGAKQRSEAGQQCETGQLRGADLSDVSLLIGRYGDAATGSRLLCVGGLHGNEPAGVYALRRVIDTLNAKMLHQRIQLLL